MDPKAQRDIKAVAIFFLATLGAVPWLASCAPVQVSAQKATARLVATAPEWRVGDRWRHAWTAGTERGVKTSEVAAIREVGGDQYYVLRVEDVNRYYTPDLRWAANVADSRVAARAVPPQPWFMWPLEAGRRWQHRGVYEDPGRKEPMLESYTVLGVEQVEVPAGTFQAFKLVREGGLTGSDQYWYAPDVRWYVKWVGRRGKDEFQEVLEEFRPAAQTALPASANQRP